jgi:hypothetical protein
VAGFERPLTVSLIALGGVIRFSLLISVRNQWEVAL